MFLDAAPHILAHRPPMSTAKKLSYWLNPRLAPVIWRSPRFDPSHSHEASTSGPFWSAAACESHGSAIQPEIPRRAIEGPPLCLPRGLPRVLFRKTTNRGLWHERCL
jgi:hypothetical protein